MLPDPQRLLVRIRGTQNLSQRVNYMNVAIETVQRIDQSSTVTDASEQTEFRRQMLAEIEK